MIASNKTATHLLPRYMGSCISQKMIQRVITPFNNTTQNKKPKLEKVDFHKMMIQYSVTSWECLVSNISVVCGIVCCKYIFVDHVTYYFS
jgi:hypothetical protein